MYAHTIPTPQLLAVYQSNDLYKPPALDTIYDKIYDKIYDTLYDTIYEHSRELTLSRGMMFAAKTDMTGSTCDRTRDGGQKRMYFSMKRVQNPDKCLLGSSKHSTARHSTAQHGTAAAKEKCRQAKIGTRDGKKHQRMVLVG